VLVNSLGEGLDGVVRLITFAAGGLGFIGAGAAKELVAKKVVRRKRVVGCIVVDGRVSFIWLVLGPLSEWFDVVSHEGAGVLILRYGVGWTCSFSRCVLLVSGFSEYVFQLVRQCVIPREARSNIT
jgi:hypothetical protein